MYKPVKKHINISEFRRNLAQYLKRAKNEPVIIDSTDSPRVVLSAEQYNRLVSAWEDQRDAEELSCLVSEDEGERFSWEDIKKEHGLQS